MAWFVVLGLHRDDAGLAPGDGAGPRRVGHDPSAARGVRSRLDPVVVEGAGAGARRGFERARRARVLAIGAATGIALYVGTLVFVGARAAHPGVRPAGGLAYRRAATADPRRELLLSLLLAVPGEELFWRGIAYRVGVDTAATAGVRPRRPVPAVRGRERAEPVPADRRGRARRRRAVGRAGLVDGRRPRAARQPYPVDRIDACATPRSAGEVAARELPVDGGAGRAGSGRFCAVAAMTPRGPHCTPLVFANSGARLWLTTSRRSVKARAWRTDPSVAGLVRSEDLAVTFTGTVRTYDALGSTDLGRGRRRGDVDRPRHRRRSAPRTPGSSPATRSMRSRCRSRGPRRVASSSASIWSAPPSLDAARRAGGPGPLGRRRRLAPDLPPREGRRRARAASRGDRRAASDEIGDGALAVVGERGLVVLPVRWRAESGALYAMLPAETLALAGADADAPVALMVDRAVGVARARHGRRDVPGRGVVLRGGGGRIGSDLAADVSARDRAGRGARARAADAASCGGRAGASGSADAR